LINDRNKKTSLNSATFKIIFEILLLNKEQNVQVSPRLKSG